MKKVLLIYSLLFTFFCGYTQTVPTAQTRPNPFSYTLAKDYKNVSVGLYDAAGTHLVKTIFSLLSEKAGTHKHYFNLTDDDGNAIAPGNYQVKISCNNNTYTWLGTLGNNSDSTSGRNAWRGGTPLSDIWQTGTKIYAGMSFSEIANAQVKFDTTAARVMIPYKPFATTYAGSLFVCGNGTYRFWGGKDYQGGHNFITGELVSNDAAASLSSWTSFVGTPPQSNYPKVGDLNAAGNTGVISGMAVEYGSSGYLYVSHFHQNLINVYKTSDGTGAFVRSISIAAPTNLEFETDGFLWIAQGTTVTKYTVNSDGSLTTTGIVISGFSRVAGLSILGGNMLVLDAGTQQVVKEYNTTTHSLIRTVGTVGGYSSSPTVTNTKFYIEDQRGQYITFVRFCSNGTWWIGDTGNNRALHFDALGNYIESIAYFSEYTSLSTGVQNGITYNLNIVQNENTNVFQDFLEYQIDYSQPFAFGTGYTLKNNWGYNLPASWHNTQTITAIDSMSNGRRYAILTQLGGGNSYMAELTSTGLRIIMSPALTPFSTFDLSGNGNLTSFATTNSTGNATLVYKKNVRTGFSSNNPTYAGLTTIGTIASGFQEPLPAYDRAYSVTASNKAVVFDPTINGSKNGTPYYHLACYDASTFTRLWRVQPSTFTAYSGPLPINAFDIGNLVKKPGGSAVVSGNDIFFNYHGEFWKNQQTGIVCHYNDIGLLQGMYGFVGPQIQGQSGTLAGAAYPGYFTNNQTFSVSTHGNKKYIWSPDESIHCGASVEEVDTADVKVQTVSITIAPRAFTVASTKTDLLASVPDGQVSVNHTANWTQFPTTDYNNSTIDRFYTRTRINTIDKTKSPDIQLYSGGSGSAHYFLKRVLPAASNVSHWQIKGKIDLSNAFTISGNNVWIEIDDSSNRAIAKVFFSTSGLTFDSTLLDAATMAKYSSCDYVLTKKGSSVFLQINLYGHKLKSTQAALGSSDITNPKYISFNQQMISAARGMQIGIIELAYE